MAGTEREGSKEGGTGAFDTSGEESDDIDQNADDDGLLAGVREKFSRGAEADGDDDVDEDSGGLLERLASAVGDDENTGPSRAELVDGANVLFIDPAAKSKALYEYDLVLITAPQYPEPVVLKNDAPIEVPKGSVLCSSTSATMIDYAGKRVLARSYILVPPSRADEVSSDYREEIPEPIAGKTIPRQELQNEKFYNLVLNGAAD